MDEILSNILITLKFIIVILFKRFPFDGLFSSILKAASTVASINKTTSEFSAEKAKLLTANVTESDKLNLVVLPALADPYSQNLF
jgi:hypothetical protein